MSRPRSPLMEDFAKLANDVAGVAGGVRREIETIVRTQIERLLSTMDVVTREEFEAVRDMAARARDENDLLSARLAEVERKLAAKD
jgi:BMFP domain-containing protein YqiC